MAGQSRAVLSAGILLSGTLGNSCPHSNAAMVCRQWQQQAGLAVRLLSLLLLGVPVGKLSLSTSCTGVLQMLHNSFTKHHLPYRLTQHTRPDSRLYRQRRGDQRAPHLVTGILQMEIEGDQELLHEN